MIDLIHKPVNNRRLRPNWALDDRQLMLRCVGKRHTIRFQIAQMYWQKNMTSADIATALNMSHTAVRMVLSRLLEKRL